MQTDLSFQPVTQANPKRLTPDQIAFYNEHGYLMPFTVYDEVHADRNRAYFDFLLAELRTFQDGRDACDGDGSGDACAGKTTFCPLEKIYGEHSRTTALFRFYRDEVLRTTLTGREIIRLYYQWSPVIGEVMDLDRQLRNDD